MKRSEAILLMTQTLGQLQRGGWQEAHDSERMDRILEALEKAGMAPPHTKVINCNCYDHNWESESE